MVVACSSKFLRAVHLRTEWLVNPLGVESAHPRLSWELESSIRGQGQAAYRVLFSSSRELLRDGAGDLGDTGKIHSTETSSILYSGQKLKSNDQVFWKVKVWDKWGNESEWSDPAYWSMGLLNADDWHAQWISYRDPHPLHKSRESLFLPPAQYYRREFRLGKQIQRATAFVSALGLFDFYINGKRVGDAYFQPGWSDYLKRVYYRTFDVTSLMEGDRNVIGAIVADGWYSGYVGFGLLVGYGPHKVGRYLYGKTPALLVQVEIEYADGTRDRILSDSTWQVSNSGPIREADLIMGEAYDARRDCTKWCHPGASRDEWDFWKWEGVIEATDSPSCRAVFTDTLGDREVELGFQEPLIRQSYLAPAIRVTQVLPVQGITETKPGTYIVDFGQNFAGIVRIRVQGAAGDRVQLRYGEKLYPDGSLMTENLRKARATDFYIMAGRPEGEEWSPRFTYHGFQYIEISGLTCRPLLTDIAGLVLHNDMEDSGDFECSDEVLTKFAENARWTQRANFVEVPTDCPQRDERLGWMADAQIYVRAASYNADVAAFFTKWLDDVREAQLPYGAYPDFCPFPMAHGKSFSTGWSDAGIICPWTMWKVYGDKELIERQWESMSRFMTWREATSTPAGLGAALGNHWGDWLNAGEDTPVEYIDLCYHALTCQLMAEMGRALGKEIEAANYSARWKVIQAAFQTTYISNAGMLKIDSQTAYALALCFGLIPKQLVQSFADKLAEKIQRNDCRMATGFLGTRYLLPALSANGHHELAVRLFQSRDYPSWAYEVVNGATSVWERWDSYTTENGFNGQDGTQNAAMNSFSHYAFGSVMEWGYRYLAGIDSIGEGYRHIEIKPGVAVEKSDANIPVISWVKARYKSVRGQIAVTWRCVKNRFELEVTVPPNTEARVHIPGLGVDSITENGLPLSGVADIAVQSVSESAVVVSVPSGSYQFVSLLREPKARVRKRAAIEKVAI